MFKSEENEENCEDIENDDTNNIVNDVTSVIEEVNEDEQIKIVDTFVDVDNTEYGNDAALINPSHTDKLLSAKPKVFKLLLMKEL